MIESLFLLVDLAVMVYLMRWAASDAAEEKDED